MRKLSLALFGLILLAVVAVWARHFVLMQLIALGGPPPLLEAAKYRYIGKPVPRIDLQAKVFGDPIFGMDASIPDMLHGQLRALSFDNAVQVIDPVSVQHDVAPASGTPDARHIVR